MKFLMVVISLCFSLLSHAQTEKASVYRYRCFQVTSYTGPEATGPWLDRDFLVVIDLAKKKIHTYTGKEEDIDLTDKTSTENNDPDIITLHLEGIDQEGKHVLVTVYVFKHSTSYHVATLLLNFPKEGFTLGLRLKNTD